jgi:hypothetical protein
MTHHEFEQELKKRGYSFKRAVDEIIVTHRGDVRLNSLKILPSGVRFQNQGWVSLHSLKILSPGVQFQNQGYVDLSSLKSLPPGVRFENKGDVYLNSLESLPPGVRSENRGEVYLNSLVGGWFEDWKGNIEGVNTKRLLHLMIDKGVFL